MHIAMTAVLHAILKYNTRMLLVLVHWLF